MTKGTTRKPAESGTAKDKAKAKAEGQEAPTKAEAAPDADQKPEPHEAEQTQADQQKSSGSDESGSDAAEGQDDVQAQRDEEAKAQGFAPPDGEGADPESANPGAERPDSVPTGARDDVADGASEASPAATADDEQSERSTVGGEQRAVAAPGGAFDGAIEAGASNMETSDDEPVSDALVGTGQPQGNMYGEEGVGARSMTGYVAPGGSNAEFSEDVSAEKGSTARGAASTPAAGPLDAPESGYSNEGGEESYPRDAYQADAGPRPEEEAPDSDVEIVGKDGSALSSGDLFTDPQGAQTFVFTKARIYEQYTYPNTVEKAKRLLYPEGARVGVAEAQAIRDRAS
jgi:hypothetical protein